MYDRNIVEMLHILDMKLVYVIFRGFANPEIPLFSKLGWDGVSQYKWTNSPMDCLSTWEHLRAGFFSCKSLNWIQGIYKPSGDIWKFVYAIVFILSCWESLHFQQILKEIYNFCKRLKI